MFRVTVARLRMIDLPVFVQLVYEPPEVLSVAATASSATIVRFAMMMGMPYHDSSDGASLT